MREIMRKNPMLLIGSILLIAILLCVAFVPVISPYKWSDVDGTMRYTAPSAEHWYGTTRLGQDLFVNIWQGGRLSLALALFAVIPFAFIGTMLGLLSGSLSGKVDFIISQVMTFVHAFPLFPLLMILGIGLRQLEVSRLQILYIALFVYSVFSTPTLFKVIRVETIRIRAEEYMKATEILGIGRWSRLWRHVFPNLVSHVIVAALQFMAHILIIELLLYFIGVGLGSSQNQPTTPSWGNLIPNIRGENTFKEYYWTWFFPISTIALTTISLRLISEGLRIHFDPKTSE